MNKVVEDAISKVDEKKKYYSDLKFHANGSECESEDLKERKKWLGQVMNEARRSKTKVQRLQ